MKIFYSAKANSFYRDDFHGTRTIWVSDPEWVRPEIEIDNPDRAEGDEESPEKISVPDISAVAPMVEVQNPNCLLPPESELLEITEAEHQDIQLLLSSTQTMLSSDENGRPILIDRPGQSSEEKLAGARSQRDRLISYATLRIDPLQDDVDLGEATEEGIALLRAWKKYRSEVNKTQDKPGWWEEPQWPTPPVPLEYSREEQLDNQ